ncbi:MAG: 5'/3'-nucleotidase SurE [Candidatus Sabulitectum sp.]|nr:5'/3'-nucleotidase SurE [Candidatus Sabulitectum sp.]
MKILLVNDDGFDEPGLKALEDALSGHDTITVAPYHHHSGASMSVNIHSSLTLREHDFKRYSVEGTPVECVKLALTELISGDPPDLLVSGINPGANVANNTWYSGTVAAATEAAFWHIPAIAISQEYASSPDFMLSSKVIQNVVEQGLFRMIKPGMLLNINVPAGDHNGYRMTTVGSFATEIPFTREGDGESYRYGPYEMQPVREQSGTDVHALLNGHISFTLLSSLRSSQTPANDLRLWCSRQS